MSTTEKRNTYRIVKVLNNGAEVTLATTQNQDEAKGLFNDALDNEEAAGHVWADAAIYMIAEDAEGRVLATLENHHTEILQWLDFEKGEGVYNKADRRGQGESNG